LAGFTLLIGVDDANRIHERSPAHPRTDERSREIVDRFSYATAVSNAARFVVPETAPSGTTTNFDTTPESDDEFARQSDQHDATDTRRLTGRSVFVPFGQSAIGLIFRLSHATSIMKRRAKPLPAFEIPWQRVVDPLS
jgi:hypothetical protein